MRSTADNPLSFFDWYLESGLNKDLKSFYSGVFNGFEPSRIEKIDKIKHTFNFLKDTYQEGELPYIVYSFENSVKSKLSQEIKLTKQFIERGFKDRFADTREIKGYADFLRIKLSTFSHHKVLIEFPFLHSYFDELNTVINIYSTPLSLPINTHNLSFVFKAESISEQLTKVKSLHLFLIETPPIIECSEQDFVNAFTGKEINGSIKWLIQGKNKKVSKTSLLYFLDELIDKDFLNRSIINDLYKYIRYVFRDHQGNELKNLKQSRSTMSNNPTSKARLDSIISSLQL